MCDRTSDPTTYDIADECAICGKAECEHGAVDQHEFMDEQTWQQKWSAAA